MADQNVSADSCCNMEISMRPEPHLEATQDLELLAQEIAEAVVEEERRSSNTPSPTPSQSQTSDISCELILETKETIPDTEQDLGGEDVQEPVTENERRRERERSQSPVDDEGSWEIVDAEEEHQNISQNDEKTKPPEQNYSIVRKFLGGHDLWQKLKDIGMVCDICNDRNMDFDDNSGGDNNQHLSASGLIVSCSESMVVCNMPQDVQQAVGDNADEVPHQLLLREMPEGPTLHSWQGTVAGAMVVVELERLGGLLVASVKVNHGDLLSALSSLQQLAASAGLVSYADVDVPSLLARAA